MAFFFGEFGKFQNAHDIVFNTQFSEDRGFLRQITNSVLRPFVHRGFGDIVVIEEYFAAVGFYEANDHIETGGFPSTVWAKQANDLSLVYFQGNAFYNFPSFIGFY